MPAIWEDNNGVIHDYIPPRPKPPTPTVDTPQFQKAVNTAGTATTAYEANPNKANTTALNNDWNAVQEMIAEQYRLAMSSSDPAKQVADLNQQYGRIFHNSKGATANIYSQYILPAAQKEAQGETPGQRNAEIQLYNGLNEPDSSPTKAYDVAQADINVQLQILYGNGTDGVYTAAQYKAAEAAADKDFGSAFAPVIDGVGTSMQEGKSYDTLLQVLQTEGPQVTPGSIGSQATLSPAQIQSLEKTGLKLTDAQVAALGDLLTPQEKDSKTLILTPGEAQLVKIDPVTLSLLMTAGINIPQLSPQMLEIAKSSPSTFFYMEANGINISVGPADSCPPKGVAQLNLGNGQQLDITINGKPLTTAQLPPGQSGAGQPSTGQIPSTVLGVYLTSEAASKGSGVVVPGSVAVANLLLSDPNLNLQVTPKTLSDPTTPQLRSLTFLVTQADSARPGYVDTTLSSLLAAAPPPNSKGATAYFANVINPFLTTQGNGFFSSDDAVNFWNSSPVIDTAGAGSGPKSSLHAYLQSWVGTLFNNPDDQRQLLYAGGNLKQMLAGAPPGLAKMLIPMVEGQVNKIAPQNQSGAIAAVFDGLSAAVQIADQFPVLSTAKNPPANAAATQVAGWLDSLGHHEAFYSLGVGDRLYDDTAMYGYTDLANALMSHWPGGILATDIHNGEQDYNSTLQKQLGTANYDAFQNNKAQVLNGFFGQFSNTSNIGKPISTSDTAALKQAIIAAYGFTPQELAPVTTHNGTQTVTGPSQATNIVNIDLSWIQNQSIPGSTVTILPFMFASAGLANGTQGGVFFDVWNPPHKETRQRYEGRAGTQTEQVDVGPSHVLIDGSAAGDALQMDPNLPQHPEKSDVKWHYSSYRDFQLSNTAYQNGTIYTLPGNQLGIGPDGAASSATDFHKEFDEVMSDIVGASQVVGLVLAPFTGGISLGITGSLGLVWGTYQGIEGYDDAKSHGENFSLSNPNTRWEAISDITVAAGWATMGVAGAEATLARDAAGAAGTLETATDEAGTLTTIADEPDTVTTAADQPGALDGVGEGGPVLAPAPGTVAAGTSNTLKALGVTKQVLEYGNYGLATVQTGKQIQSLSADYDNMSFWQRVNALAGIFEATIPFAAEPMNRAAFGGDWSRPGQQPPGTVVSTTDVTSESDSDLEGRPQTVAAIAPEPTAGGKPPMPVTPTSDGPGAPVGGGPPTVPPTGPGGGRNPFNPDDWSGTPIFFVHTQADGTALVWRLDENGLAPVEDPRAPWGEEGPPAALRIVEIATPDPTDSTVVAINMLTGDTTDGSTYNRTRVADSSVTFDSTRANSLSDLLRSGGSRQDSELEEGGTWPRPEPVLANATYLLDNTQKLIDRMPVEIHEDHITADYSTIQAKRAERIARNLRLDINMFFEEHFQRELEHHSTLTRYARKAVELIHDQLEFASMDPLIKGPLLVRTDLREAQIRHLTEGLEGYFPEGSLQEFLDSADWSDDKFKAFLATFTGEKGGRAHQVAETDMKILRQLNTQVPYFGGSVEYEQNERSLEYYVYHISTLTRDSKQQYGVDSDQGNLLPRDLKTYRTNAEGKVPFGNLRNLGEGATDTKMTFEGWPPELRKRAEIELNRLRTDPRDGDIKQVAWLNTVDAAWLAAWQQQSGETPREAPSAAELWNGSNEDLKKHIFSDILRLPWSADHLHGGPGYDQRTTVSDLQLHGTTSFIPEKLPSPPDGKPGLMNVAGVYANFLLKPDIASQQYATDPRFIAVQKALDDGTLAELFPGAVPPGDQTLQKQFERLHGDWHAEALANFKPIVGGISGHTLSYMNLYDEALSKVPESERAQYPTPEQLRAVMFAGLIGTKRHHSYDEVMSASTSTMNDSIPAESYQHPNSYEDVLKSEDPLIRESAEQALTDARERYTRSSNTVLATIKRSLESNPKIPQIKSERLTEAVARYLEGLGGDQAQVSKRFSKAVAESLKPNVILAVKEEVKKIRQSRR